jgi:hypothetical protein
MSCIVNIVAAAKPRYILWGNAGVLFRMKSAAHNAKAPSPRSNRLRPVAVSKTNRSALSNGLTILRGVDGRSPEGRRFRDLVVSYADELGGAASLSEQDAALVRHAAAVTMQSEALQGAVVRGEHIDQEQFVRLGNSLTRALNALKARRKPKAKGALDSILERHRADEARDRAT